MKGLQFLLQSFGIEIDPAQIQTAFEQGKDALPRIAASFDDLNSRMGRIEAKLELLLSRTAGEVESDPIHHNVLGNVSGIDLQIALMNGAPELVVRNG
jgi:hypothetical protein